MGIYNVLSIDRVPGEVLRETEEALDGLAERFTRTQDIPEGISFYDHYKATVTKGDGINKSWIDLSRRS